MAAGVVTVTFQPPAEWPGVPDYARQRQSQLPAQTVAGFQAGCGHCKGRHGSIQAVRECAGKYWAQRRRKVS